MSIKDSGKKKALEPVMEQGYGYLPKSVMRSPELDQKSKLVYSFLVSHAGKGMNTFPGISTSIAPCLKMKPQTVINAIRILEEKKYITVERRYGKSHIYKLNDFKVPPLPTKRVLNNSKKAQNNTREVVLFLAEHWNSYSYLLGVTIDSPGFSINDISISHLESHTVEDLVRAIDNYAQIYRDKEYDYNTKWKFIAFLEFGINDFWGKNEPHKKYQKKKASSLGA